MASDAQLPKFIYFRLAQLGFVYTIQNETPHFQIPLHQIKQLIIPIVIIFRRYGPF